MRTYSSDDNSAQLSSNKLRSRRSVIRNLVGGAAVLSLAVGSRASPAKAGSGGWGGPGGGGPGGGWGGPGRDHDPHDPGDHWGHCFLRGTRISTPTGDISIESLKIGDPILTISGDVQPTRWIGRMSFRRQQGESWGKGVAPIRISKSAIADGVPHTDVLLSPAHMLLLDGYLVPCGQLVNGITIRQERMSSETQLDYFHIELASHDVLFAEGLPAETLMGDARRMEFDNYREYELLYPTQTHVSPLPFAPILSLNGGREELRSRMRSAFAPFVDRREPFDVARDRLEERAEEMRLG
ncbi:hypothetical protein HYPP_02274 [Hyphomicrobium sp. ghe19]|nr:hypothetical protein HYPP_02274 [Hyphomicrobium sp. ghe19]